MLVLCIDVGQKIVIADGEVVVTYLEKRGGKIRLGFEASKDISIDRKAVHDRKEIERAAS